eukprot:2346755-Alexandrium_andersonii.AAC.1
MANQSTPRDHQERQVRSQSWPSFRLQAAEVEGVQQVHPDALHWGEAQAAVPEWAPVVHAGLGAGPPEDH